MAVHDVRGRLVRSLPAGSLDAGPHTLAWDGWDDSGRAVASGAYGGLPGGTPAPRWRNLTVPAA